MSRVKVSCVDTLGLCATRKVGVPGGCRAPATGRDRWYALGPRFVMRGNGEAATYLLNPTRARRRSPAPVFTAVGGVGALSFGDAEGLSVEGRRLQPDVQLQGAPRSASTPRAGSGACSSGRQVPQNDQVSTGFKDVLAFRNPAARCSCCCR